MTFAEKKEFISELNKSENKNNNYGITKNGRVFYIFMGKKEFTTIEFIKEIESEFIENYIIRENFKKILEYLENNKAEILGYSCNSKYYLYKGYKIRISDHGCLTDKFPEPSFNFFANKKNEYLEVIEKLKAL